MISLLGRRPMLWPTLVFIPGMVILFMLGSWQMDRLAWKNNLEATVAAGLEKDPVDMPVMIEDPETFHYVPARATGTFHHDKEMHLFAHSRNGNPGYQIFTPLERADGSFVIVNRGWVPKHGRDPQARLEAQLEGTVTVTGLGRKGWPKAFFVAENVPEANEWFFGDVDQMARSKGLDTYLPLYLYADDTPNPGGWPAGGQAKVTFINNHLEYALTWYGMMLVLAAIYVLFHRQSAREEAEKDATA